MNESPDRDDLPPPLLGCLFCHVEGGMSLNEPRKILGIGGNFPILTCSHCGSTALFDFGDIEADTRWRIRYRRFNQERHYYYAGLYLGKGGWLDADDAIDISTRAYIQRQRVRQSRQGDLYWLKPAPLSPPPPLMNPHENVYMAFQHVTYYQGQPNRFSAQANANSLDSGSFFVTDAKIHLLGHRRDWSYSLSEIESVEYNQRAWVIHLRTSSGVPEYFSGENHPSELDAQLVAAVLQSLRGDIT
jgi:hypothetical protein